jgi:hypothetical protein
MNIQLPGPLSTTPTPHLIVDLDLDGPGAMQRADRRHRAWRAQRPAFRFRPASDQRFPARISPEPAWE